MLCNPNFLVSWPTDKCEGSKWGKIWPGIQWAWSQTCDTSPCPLIGRNSQWEAENPNFPVSWPTDKCEGSKWGRIWPGIQWAWSQTCDTSPCPLIGRNSQWEAENPNFLVIWLTDKCEGSKLGRILPGIHWALLLAEIANGSEWLRMTPGWVRMRARGEGWEARGERRGGLLLSRFYFSKWLTFPVLGHKKVLVF